MCPGPCVVSTVAQTEVVTVVSGPWKFVVAQGKRSQHARCQNEDPGRLERRNAEDQRNSRKTSRRERQASLVPENEPEVSRRGRSF